MQEMNDVGIGVARRPDSTIQSRNEAFSRPIVEAQRRKLETTEVEVTDLGSLRRIKLQKLEYRVLSK